MNNTATRAVIYCRVSTKEQVEEGNSLNTQQKICKEYALKNGYEVAEIFVEQGESAKTTDRTELKRLLNYCAVRKNCIQAVIAYKIDRISRNTDDYSHIRILLKRYGVEIKSTSEFFENTPAGRFMENIIANVAQFDNDVRTERSTMGMKEAVRDGRYVWPAPFGYSNSKIGGKANISPNEKAVIVRKAFEEVAKNQFSIDEVRRQLMSFGLIQSDKEMISRSRFYCLLRNEIYAGWIIKFKERHRGVFQPIISEELFQQVQRVIKYKRRNLIIYSINNSDFPLRRFIYNPSNLKLTGGWSQGRRKKYPYYRFKEKGANYPKNLVEGCFKAFLNKFELDDKYLAEFKRNLSDNLVKHTKCSQKQREILEKTISDTKKDQSTLINKNIQGIIGDEILKHLLEDSEKKLLKATASLMSLSDTNIPFNEILRRVYLYFKNPALVWEKAPADLKLRLQWFYFPEGITYDGKNCRTAEICRIFKTKTSSLDAMSCIVHHRNTKLNTPKVGNPYPITFKPYVADPFWNGVANELVYLDEIVKNNGEESDSLLDSNPLS